MRRLSENDPDFSLSFREFISQEQKIDESLRDQVTTIIKEVRQNRDQALFAYTSKFDFVDLDTFLVSQDEIEMATAQISAKEYTALEHAARRIEAYHQKQYPKDMDYTDESGARLGWRYTPLRSVGIYVPGGRASYPSSVLMNAIPAKVAGVPRVVMAVPCPHGVLNPLVLVAAKLAGVKKIYKIGGAQAIAALAYGTESILPVDKITGPGNAYVAEAKRQVFGHVGIDMIAGPSEILIIADRNNNPDWLAIDLLSQAEHDPDARAILITDDQNFADQVEIALSKHLETITRRDIAKESIEKKSAIIVAHSLERAAHLSNIIAPEHLQICTKNPRALSHLTTEAGAIFLGANTPEAIGDYIAGPNHVLPTSGSARFSSGLSVLDFMKRSTLSEMNATALESIGPTAVTLANSEGLEAHARSVSQRLETIKAP